MYRAALRPKTTRAAVRSSTPLNAPARRFISFKPSDKPRTWKGAFVRWGLAFGALYWYNTSPIFADEPFPRTIPAPPHFSDADLPTVESVIQQKRKEAEAKAIKAAPPPPPSPSEQKPSGEVAPKPEDSTDEEPTGGALVVPSEPSPEAVDGEEQGQEAAFNPETGEINWDCPCLGGMADGPCGEEFKAAFSCFVYSKEEPKGIDCIENFQGMQECFRKYPEIYGAEIADTDGDEPPNPEMGENTPANETFEHKEPKSASETVSSDKPGESKEAPEAVSSDKPGESKEAPEAVSSDKPAEPKKADLTPAPMPKKAVDATAVNDKAKNQ